jgi:hypothetical protein
MSSTGPIVGSFQIARAYGLRPPRPASVKPPQKNTAPTQSAEPKAGARLIAAAVPGRINFAGSAPAHDTSALPMYQHPADTNAVATALSAGRLIDVSA